MKKKILIIGVNSFIGNNLYISLKNKFNIKIIHYKNFISLSKKHLIDVTYIINCASNKKYVKNKYLKKNDFDLKVAEKIIGPILPQQVVFHFEEINLKKFSV